MHNDLKLINGLLGAAAAQVEFGPVLGDFCERASADGMPFWRVLAAHLTLDPLIRADSYMWRRDTGLAYTRTPHAEGMRSFDRSPLRVVRDAGLEFGRWRMEIGEGSEFELLEGLKAEGGTDYVVYLVGFNAEASPVPGIALTFASDRPGGFTEAQLARLATFVPALGLAGGWAAQAAITRSVLALYLGQRTARNVLAGEIQRGLGRRIEAAILLADLRNFTRLTDRADPLQVVALLDTHLDALASAVADHGGEVLKFLGDGLLAAFPLVADGERPETVCAQALASAQDALARNRAINEAAQTDGTPVLDVGIVLHYGEVIYGNVGSPQRLDFTLIGRAINEASRIEPLCKELNTPLLMTKSFAAFCGRPVRSLGAHQLSGVAEKREICTLSDLCV